MTNFPAANGSTASATRAITHATSAPLPTEETARAQQEHRSHEDEGQEHVEGGKESRAEGGEDPDHERAQKSALEAAQAADDGDDECLDDDRLPHARREQADVGDRERSAQSAQPNTEGEEIGRAS